MLFYMPLMIVLVDYCKYRNVWPKTLVDQRVILY